MLLNYLMDNLLPVAIKLSEEALNEIFNLAGEM